MWCVAPVRDRASSGRPIGGADILTYREMMARYASLTGRRRRPLIKVPFFTPKLSSGVNAVPLGFDAAVKASL